MYDVLDIIKNVESIYDSNTSFNVLKDFERVLDELDIYVYKNWKDGELLSGPKISRHWVSCSFMWPANKMPDPMGGKRLLDYDCKVTFKKDKIIKPRKIRVPDDLRSMTKKGKLDLLPIWVVEIMMPKKLIADIYGGMKAMNDYELDAGSVPSIEDETQQADIDAEATAETETV
jgi:hypothetical protein